MKIKTFLFSALFFLVAGVIYSQETTLSIKEAVDLALSNSDEAKRSEIGIITAENELKITKDNQYPDFKLSGQYSYLTNADVNLKLSSGNNASETDPNAAPAESPDIHQLLLGQATISMPLFSGFRLKNAIKARENGLNAAKMNAKNNREKIALKTIQNYLNLYMARKTIELVEESLKSAKQRVKDFSAMEKNGLLARNDLLKSQIQESNVELSLEEATKNAEILNYQLVTILKLPEGTRINTNDSDFIISPKISSGEINRNDLEALKYQHKAAENNIKMAKADYFPSLGLTGGYIALDLQNALTVSNAMNIGVGVSYNLVNIFKNKNEVKLAKSKAQQLEYSIAVVSDQIKIQIKNAEQDYKLALRKFEVYTKSEEQAVENYRIVKDKYDNGLLDTNDLLEADVQQLQTKINLAYARAGITQKYFELLKAQGNLTNELN